MQTYEMINIFIDKLVQSFSDNDITHDFISKIKDMEYSGDVFIDGNKISCINRYQTREVIVDDINKTIVMKEYGDKVSYIKRTNFSCEVKYKEDGAKAYYYKNNINNELEKADDRVKIMSNSYSSTINIFEGKRHFATIVKSDKYAEKDKYGKYITLKNDESKKDFYLLANGDVLKIINKNDKEKYFYCDYSEMYGNDKANSEKAKFNVEISYNDAKLMLDNIDDAFKLINNNTIYAIKGRNY